MTQKIAEVQSHLKQSLSGIRWVEKETLHFTLKFLGSVEEEKAGPIVQTLERALHHVRTFSMQGLGLGVFPNLKKARVLWIGLQGEELPGLARQVERSLEPIGFAPQMRTFEPHLTIGRWRHSATTAEQIKQEMDRWADFEFGQSRVEEVVLFQSVLQPSGPVYSTLGTVPLKTNGEPVETNEKRETDKSWR